MGKRSTKPENFTPQNFAHGEPSRRVVKLRGPDGRFLPANSRKTKGVKAEVFEVTPSGNKRTGETIPLKDYRAARKLETAKGPKLTAEERDFALRNHVRVWDDKIRFYSELSPAIIQAKGKPDKVYYYALVNGEKRTFSVNVERAEQSFGRVKLKRHDWQKTLANWQDKLLAKMHSYNKGEKGKTNPTEFIPLGFEVRYNQ